MRKISKTNGGFTIVELVIVVGVVALLATGAVFAFQGMQQNARRSRVYADAYALVSALNNHNAQAPTMIDDPADIPLPPGITDTVTLTIPARGVQGQVQNSVHFSNPTRTRDQIIANYIEFSGGRWVVRSAAIQTIP